MLATPDESWRLAVTPTPAGCRRHPPTHDKKWRHVPGGGVDPFDHGWSVSWDLDLSRERKIEEAKKGQETCVI